MTSRTVITHVRFTPLSGQMLMRVRDGPQADMQVRADRSALDSNRGRPSRWMYLLEKSPDGYRADA